MSNVLLIFAVLLLVLWIVLRIAFAITGLFLHVLWIAAIVIVVLWAIQRIRKGR